MRTTFEVSLERHNDLPESERPIFVVAYRSARVCQELIGLYGNEDNYSEVSKKLLSLLAGMIVGWRNLRDLETSEDVRFVDGDAASRLPRGIYGFDLADLGIAIYNGQSTNPAAAKNLPSASPTTAEPSSDAEAATPNDGEKTTAVVSAN